MSEKLPDRPSPGSGLPARRLSSEQMEAVIRRATELQFAAGGADEGIAEDELLRIGRELGLEPANLRRALAEVRTSAAPVERGMMVSLAGPRVVRASRIVKRPAAQVGMLIEEYLKKCEYMEPMRRFPDRTRYARATGVAASLGRVASKLGSRQPSLDLQQLDVGVAALDADSAVVELSVDQNILRNSLTAGGAAAGSAGGTAVATFALVSGAPDPLALLAVPILAGAMWGMKAIYRTTSATVENRLEAFLDRLEHGELRLPPERPEWRRQLGI